MKRHQEASECFARSINLNDRQPHIWFNMGACLHRLNRRPDALRCFEKACELQPDGWEPWHERGALLVEMSRFQESVDCLRRCLELDPANASAWYFLGLAFGPGLKRFSEALAYFTQARRYGHPQALDCIN